jgi:hypothetical protein
MERRLFDGEALVLRNMAMISHNIGKSLLVYEDFCSNMAMQGEGKNAK